MWRAIAADGDVLNILVQRRLHTGPATRFLRKLIERCGRPRVILTDKLGSYAKALGAIAQSVNHRQPKGQNNRCKVTHRHTRRCKKVIGRFKSPGRAQRLISDHNLTCALFRPHRHLQSATSTRESTDSTCGETPPENCEPDQPTWHMPVGAADNNLTTPRWGRP